MYINWLIAILLISDLYAQTNLEKGLVAYNLRSEGNIEDQAQTEEVTEAIKYYQLALDEPNVEIEAVVGLLKSYYFKGKFVINTEDQQKIIFNKAKDLAEEYLDNNPKRADLRLWYLVNLGSWAEVYGILTAAK